MDKFLELVEHYDRWIEEFEKIRNGEKRDLETKFIFVAPKGFPFPVSSEQKFKDKYHQFWNELYG